MPADIPIPGSPDPAEAFTQSWGYVEEDSVFGEFRLDWYFADGWSLTAQYLNGQYDRDYLTGDGGEILTADGDFLIDVFQFIANVQNVTDKEYWRGYGIGLELAEPRMFS